jgi:tetratricopeptide (TPR) repeat protein
MWSDRWQENWENLPTIKSNLSGDLLKAINSKHKIERRVETTNAEAYEFYLKAKHKYDKRENTDDTEIARGLLNKTIELDDNLISAKVLLGSTYSDMGDYDKAMEIYTPAQKQAEKLGDKAGMGYSLNNIGIVHHNKGDLDKALDYYERSLAIFEELGDKRGMGNLNNIGMVHSDKGDNDRALDYYERSLAIKEQLGDKQGIGVGLINIGMVHHNKGDLDKALDYYERSLAIFEEIGDKLRIGVGLINIGMVHHDKGDYEQALGYYKKSLAIREQLGDKAGMGYGLTGIGIVHSEKGDYSRALEYLEKSLDIQKEIGLGGELLLWTNTYLYLTYKHIGKAYDVKEIYSFIKETENIEFENNLKLYELLEDKSYLETAYNQVQEQASAMDKVLAKKFLSYPIPKAIVDEYNKVFN